MSADWGFLEIDGDKEKSEFAAEALAVSIQLEIQKAMSRNSVSQKELAERLGVSSARISQILSDHGRNITLKTIGRIAHALGEDFEFILRSDLKKLRQKNPTQARKDFDLIGSLRAVETPWSDRTANENKVLMKMAA